MLIMGFFGKNKEIDDFVDNSMSEVEARLLEALRTLRDAGILSDEEYHEKKEKVLEIN